MTLGEGVVCSLLPRVSLFSGGLSARGKVISFQDELVFILLKIILTVL